MVNYKLTYFNLKGRAEPLRVILAFAGVEYDDSRFDRAELPKLKSQFPWGQVPVLEVDGVMLAQTGAIARFLAHRFNLTGDTDWEAAKCDELVNVVEDLRGIWKRTVHSGITDPALLAQARKDYIANDVPKFLEKLTSIKKENGGLWLVGTKTTWADLYISVFLASLEEAFDSTVLDHFPFIKSWKEHVFDLPRVKEYLERQ